MVLYSSTFSHYVLGLENMNAVLKHLGEGYDVVAIYIESEIRQLRVQGDIKILLTNVSDTQVYTNHIRDICSEVKNLFSQAGSVLASPNVTIETLRGIFRAAKAGTIDPVNIGLGSGELSISLQLLSFSDLLAPNTLIANCMGRSGLTNGLQEYSKRLGARFREWEESHSVLPGVKKQLESKHSEVHSKSNELRAAMQRIREFESVVRSKGNTNNSSQDYPEASSITSSDSSTAQEIQMLRDALNLSEKRLEHWEKENKLLKAAKASSMSGRNDSISYIETKDAQNYLKNQISVWKKMLLVKFTTSLPDISTVTGANKDLRMKQNAVSAIYRYALLISILCYL